MPHDPPKLTDLSLTDLPNGMWPATEVLTGAGQWYPYAIAYKEAADRLVGLMKKNTHALNVFGAPMLFLYRHSIELHLKSLLLDAGQLLDDPQTVPPQHYLWKLWIKVRKMIVQIDNGSSDNEWVRRADQIIKQFDEIDPFSFAFRYPTATDGSPSLKDELVVDPSVVSQIMSELDILLNGASNQIAEYQGLKYEGY